MTSKATIQRWFDRGVKEHHDFMIVVCDTFDYTDYPVYTSKKDFWEEEQRCKNSNMSRIMEVYDLSIDRDQQLNEQWAFHYPPVETQ